jgi:Ca2+-binding EF-hand superfamily protein
MKTPRPFDRSGDERLAELRDSFRGCDADGDGYLEYREFAVLLENLGADMSQQEIRIGFQAIDTDDDQLIEFSEFADWWLDR